MDQKVITDLLPSKQLKKIIHETKHKFSLWELWIIAENYSKTFDEKIKNLQYITAHFADAEQKETAQQIISKQKSELNKMMLEEDGTVYLVEIQEDVNSYNEHYICKNYEAAYKTVKKFKKEYKIVFTEFSIISISKWQVFDRNIDFENDELGVITLTENLKIQSANYWAFHNNFTFSPETQIFYPEILLPYSPVKYKNSYGINYGLQINTFRNDEYDDAYVIDINSESTNKEDLRNFENAHHHIPIPEMEQISVDELPDKERSNYCRMVSYLKNKNYI